MLKNIRTSTRINIVYLFFNLITIVIIVGVINLAYFYSWYSDSKIGCHSDLKVLYNELGPEYTPGEKKTLRRFFLSKMSYITLDNGDVLVSPKLLSEHKLIEDGVLDGNIFHTFYDTIKDENRYFFSFKEDYPALGDVRVVVDITNFVQSQNLVLKYSFFVFLASIVFYLMLGGLFTRFALKDLIKIVESTKNIDIDKDFKEIKIHRPKGDEIRIVADTINKSVLRIKKQSENLKGFISSMAHEFKTPLMVMNSDIDVQKLIIEKRGEDKAILNMLDNMKYRIKGMNEMLDTLFFVSRLEEGIVLIRREDINMSSLILEVVNEIKDMYSDKNIKVECDIVENLNVHIDRGSFRIVLKNLIQNAFKYNNNGGTVKIHLCEKCLSIEDNGIGMTEEQTKKIFDNFYKGSENSDGFGLGLYLVKKILGICGYNIDVKSKIGEGTKFKILFNK